MSASSLSTSSVIPPPSAKTSCASTSCSCASPPSVSSIASSSMSCLKVFSGALLRLAERGRQDQVGTHPRLVGLEATGLGAAHTVAAPALSVLPQTDEVGRLAAPATAALMNLTRLPVPAPRPLEISRRRQRRGLARLGCQARFNALHKRPKPLRGPCSAPCAIQRGASGSRAHPARPLNHLGLSSNAAKAKDKGRTPGSFNL